MKFSRLPSAMGVSFTCCEYGGGVSRGFARKRRGDSCLSPTLVGARLLGGGPSSGAPGAGLLGPERRWRRSAPVGLRQFHDVARGGHPAGAWRSRSSWGVLDPSAGHPVCRSNPRETAAEAADPRLPKRHALGVLIVKGPAGLATPLWRPEKQVRDVTKNQREAPSQKPQSGKVGSPGECC